MDDYTKTSLALARQLTRRYSSSFSLASRLFPARVASAIYAVYGLVRIADEIVDTYDGADAATLLDTFEAATYAAIKRRYSTNPLIHAFQYTASIYNISEDLIAPFFASMRMDLKRQRYTTTSYEAYIYGSAEVIGLMCLKIFCMQDESAYARLAPAARRLGSAYQKVNFLRDMAADHALRHRYYFPIGTYSTFNEAIKQSLIADIEQDFQLALRGIKQLPSTVRPAVYVSYCYYHYLLNRLSATPAADMKRKRVRISNLTKIALLVWGSITVRLGYL